MVSKARLDRPQTAWAHRSCQAPKTSVVVADDPFCDAGRLGHRVALDGVEHLPLHAAGYVRSLLEREAGPDAGTRGNGGGEPHPVEAVVDGESNPPHLERVLRETAEQ